MAEVLGFLKETGFWQGGMFPPSEGLVCVWPSPVPSSAFDRKEFAVIFICSTGAEVKIILR